MQAKGRPKDEAQVERELQNVRSLVRDRVFATRKPTRRCCVATVSQEPAAAVRADPELPRGPVQSADRCSPAGRISACRAGHPAPRKTASSCAASFVCD